MARSATYSLTGEINLPKASEIDYGDSEEVVAYSQLLGRLLEWHGGLDSPRNNSRIVRALDAEGRHWLTEVRRLLTDGPLPAIPELLDAYIFFHSVCRGWRDTGFYNEVRITAVKRWLGGDRSLNGTQIARLLWPMVCSDPHVDQRYTVYCASCLDSWIKELRRSGRFRGISDIEAFQRLSHIIGQDLFAFIAGGKEVERATKLNWAKAYMVEDTSVLTTAALKAYIPFAMSVADLRRIPFEAREAGYEALCEELAARADLHPMYRESIRLMTANRERLLADRPEATA